MEYIQEPLKAGRGPSVANRYRHPEHARAR